MNKIKTAKKNGVTTDELARIELISIRKKLDNIVYRHELEFLKDRVSKLEEKVGLKR